ncbi:hypothetical protein OH77DRAFT_494880 [Trametes cingulata]|nr:hypothetical protein OH77DRAFT_494880 [Trametes cingulata]
MGARASVPCFILPRTPIAGGPSAAIDIDPARAKWAGKGKMLARWVTRRALRGRGTGACGVASTAAACSEAHEMKLNLISPCHENTAQNTEREPDFIMSALPPSAPERPFPSSSSSLAPRCGYPSPSASRRPPPWPTTGETRPLRPTDSQPAWHTTRSPVPVSPAFSPTRPAPVSTRRAHPLIDFRTSILPEPHFRSPRHLAFCAVSCARPLGPVLLARGRGPSQIVLRPRRRAFFGTSCRRVIPTHVRLHANVRDFADARRPRRFHSPCAVRHPASGHVGRHLRAGKSCASLIFTFFFRWTHGQGAREIPERK